MASKNKNLAELLDANGDVLLSNLDNVSVTPTAVSDQPNTSTGGFSLPSGTEAQRPGTPDTGETRFNSDSGSVEFYDGTTWVSTNLIPTIDSVSGNIVPGFATDLTLSLTNATDSIDVVFKEGATTLATVSSVSVSSGSATVTVPSAVYGQTSGDTITISIGNQDGTPSSNSQNKTVGTLPTGGTITTSGDYRIHTFTSSSTFAVNDVAPTVDILMVAGGGGGGAGSSGSTHSGAGGGAGGMYTSTSQSLSTSTNYTVTIGSGGARSTNPESRGSSGGNTSFTGQTTAIGGGGGGSRGSSVPGTHYGLSGGSGGGSVPDSGTYPGGAGTSGQGNAGGSCNRDLSRAASGGGGKGSVGASPQDHLGNTDSVNGANGGSGGTNDYTGSTVSYAGGGGSGGAAWSSYVGTAGASGVPANGGAGGSTNNSGQGGSASDNTGGGGGGAYCGAHFSAVTNGGNGGSGICVVRYDATAL